MSSIKVPGDRHSYKGKMMAYSFTLIGLCSSSVTAALALMTVSTQSLLMDRINFTLIVDNFATFRYIVPRSGGEFSYCSSLTLPER